MTAQPFSTRHVSLSGPDLLGFQAAPAARALILGGGGSAGNAWLLGVVAGLFEAGVDVTGAELTVGTSAGSTAAAQIHAASPPQLLQDMLDAGPQRPAAPHGTAPARAPGGAAGNKPPVNHLERTAKIIAGSVDPADMRRAMGQAALHLDGGPDPQGQGRWRSTVASRLPSQSWPMAGLLVTAVHAESGDPVVFDRRSGVELADAVAASCSSGVPYRIGNSWYIDGGYRRNENADLAAGSGRVLVFSPLGGRTRHPQEWGLQLSVQVDELRAGGSRVETVLPDEASLDAFGTNLMDPSTRLPAALAGQAQGTSLAGQLAQFWG